MLIAGPHAPRQGFESTRVFRPTASFLVPGPQDEIDVVNRIFRTFVEDNGLQESQIAEMLNLEGIRTDLGRLWTRGTIHQILTNEKYIGTNIFNQTSFKLKKHRVVNDPTMWIRAEGAFEPVVDRSLFEMAQQIIQERSRHLSDEEMLARLEQLYK